MLIDNFDVVNYEKTVDTVLAILKMVSVELRVTTGLSSAMMLTVRTVSYKAN